MKTLANALPRPVRPHGWCLLLPVVMLAAFCCWGVRPWTGAVLVMAVGVTLLVPAFAADLVPVALIGFGMYACGLATRFSPLPPGSPTSAGYPLHTLLFGESNSHVGIDMTAGIVMLTIGAFLVPRTIGAHSVLARRNGELMSRVRRLAATRVDAVDGAAAELRRVERDLHDGAQARLVALGISLRATERLIPVNPDAAVALVAEARESSARALAELRALVRGINPPVLAERGLGDAIRALALDCPVPTTAAISCTVPGRRLGIFRSTVSTAAGPRGAGPGSCSGRGPRPTGSRSGWCPGPAKRVSGPGERGTSNSVRPAHPRAGLLLA